VEITRSKGASSSTEQLFLELLGDSVTQTFSEVLGSIAGQALLDAVETHTSLKAEYLPQRPDVLDQALRAYLGSAAGVLERRLLRTLTGKTLTGIAPGEGKPFDFTSEVEKIKKQFLKRKRARNQPQILE
jgi:hypothetical protein